MSNPTDDKLDSPTGIKLKYIGNGAAIPPYTDEKGEEVPGVPARDLTEAEARFHGGIVYLIKSGLYERVEEKPKQVRPLAGKAGK
jgi:hypothetical protein